MNHFREVADNSDDSIITMHYNDFNIIGAYDAARKALKLPTLSEAKIKCYKHFH
jgi:hypothetical protein